MNMMLNVFKNFWNNLIARLSMPSMLFAIGFAILGVSLGIIARKVAVVVRKTNEIDNKDPIMIGIQSVGVACLFVSILIIVIRAGV
jgi:hypothetical protein